MQENPKIPGKPSHARYEKYKCASSLAEARELLGDGWDEDDNSWDFNRGYLRIFPQSMQLNTAFVAAGDSPEEWPEGAGALRFRGGGPKRGHRTYQGGGADPQRSAVT